MSSQRRIDASRANGARSQGPITAEGKARAAQNARTHELTAKIFPCAVEDSDQFEALHHAYLAQFQPQTQTERDMIEEMAVCKWRQMRAWSLETAVINHQMERRVDITASSDMDVATSMALAVQSLVDSSRILSNLGHHEFRNARRWTKNMLLLERRRNDDQNRKNEPSPTSEQQAA